MNRGTAACGLAPEESLASAKPQAGFTSPLLVFADDWGRHPSSCQHLVRQLLPSHEVNWVNTIGTRAPGLNWLTLKRSLEKFGQWFRPSAVSAFLPNNLQLLNPRMWPWFRSSFDRWLNRRLLTRQLIPWLQRLPEPAVAVTTLPIVADILDDLPVRRWVYYCVDDFSQWPGLDHRSIGQMELKMLQRVDRVVAVSETLRDRMANLGRKAELLTHGVDLDFWSRENHACIPALQDLQKPLVVFFGLIDRRLDLELLRRLDEELSGGTILLVGPQAEPDPSLGCLRRAVVWPALSYEQLPVLVKAADVLIMPYADLPVTRAMQPLKLKEYLAGGKPAVVRDLPANLPWGDCLDLAAGPEDFAHLVRLRLHTGLPEEQRRARERLRNESWSEKARQFQQMLDGVTR